MTKLQYLMNSTTKCFNCRASLSSFTTLYYCCNEERPLCRRCKPSICLNCKKDNWKEIKQKQCRICKRRLGVNEGLQQQLCGDYYCPRCLSNIYQPYYLDKNPPIIIEMMCGHYKDKLDIEAVLANHCINCGFKFKQILDYQLQDAMKLCHYCFQYEGKKFQEFFQRCISCAQILKYNEVVRLDVLLCRQCSESQTFIEQSIVNSHVAQTNQTSIISNLRSQKMHVHHNNQDEQPSQELSIVSRFSAFQIQDEHNNKKNRLSSMRILSKNSVEIRVQNYKLPPIIKEDRQLVRCQLCNILIELVGTLPNTTYSKSRICKMCFAQTFDKSYISYSRQAYSQSNIQNNQRINSLPKNNQPIQATMKKSMIAQPNDHNRPFEPHRFQAVVVSRVDTKQPWQTASPKKNLCEICQIKSYMIIRANKKICADCGNKYR